MSERKKLSQPVRITVYHNGQLIFEKVFSHYPIHFGRSPKCEVPLEFDFISRQHCQLFETQPGQWRIQDLKSSNGIRVGGKRTPEHDFTEECEFYVGSIKVFAEVSPAPKGLNLQSEQTAPTLVPGTKKAPTNSEPHIVAVRPSHVAKTVPVDNSPPPSIKDSTKDDQTEPSAKQVPPAKVPSKPMPAMAKPAPSGQIKPLSVEPAAAKESPVQHSHGHSKHHPTPIIHRDFSDEMVGYYHGIGHARSRRVEAVVTWHDQVYEVREFRNSQTISIGPKGKASLGIPAFRETWTLGKVGFEEIQCSVPQGFQVSLTRETQDFPMGDLIASKALQPDSTGYSLRASVNDVVHVELGHGFKVHLRHVPTSKPLPISKFAEMEDAVRQTFVTSALFHICLIGILLMNTPKDPEGPKLKNVPQRFARLLVEKPKPTPAPTPAPTPEPKKEIVKKKEPPKKIVKKEQPKKEPPKQIVKEVPKVITTPKAIAKVNKFPMEVKNPVKQAPPPVKVEALGALAALGAVSASAPTNVVTNININPNAGGAPTKINTGGIVGALPSSSGKLAAAGNIGSVKTKGMGYGTGTGYGVQGLKGTAGARGVAGAVVGEPKLASSSSKTEGLTRAQVMAVVQQHIQDIQHCYEKNLLLNPNLAGRMEFEWEITPAGRVATVGVKRSTVNQGDGLGECVKKVFAAMKFPAAANGQSTVPSIGFPFGRM
ncbi:MAG: AgmX/PglI C-terminal domain-containing protein [Oligoflexia bacterium]|nr:AgmX/PglI C-terminal domain-containing protein [Oligoflexia bacterium]